VHRQACDQAQRYRGPIRAGLGRTVPSARPLQKPFYPTISKALVCPTRLDRCRDGGNNIGMPQEERAVIYEVERRLAEKYAALPADHITAVVQHAYALFQSSRVRDFIPLLVERRADEELEELSVLRPDLAAVALDDLGMARSRTIAAV
jgi:hypothetical protein